MIHDQQVLQSLACFVLAWISSVCIADEPKTLSFNYAEALQKSLYFYEAQQSGELSPNNREPWRGPACMNDGQDIGHDLNGGWFDAGDHWTANLTMSFAATTLAWSAIEEPEGYLQSEQMDELLEELIYVDRYFLKCVLNPECSDPAHDLVVAIGCGGREGVPAPNVHAMWAPAEVAHLMTNRPTFCLNKNVPGGDIPAAMASAMAASSIVIRRHASVLRDKPGYETFDAESFADQLVGNAEKLLLFAHANAGAVISDDMSSEEKQEINRRRALALRSDGEIVEIGYRSGPFDKIFTAATFLHLACKEVNPDTETQWLVLAETIYDGPYREEHCNAAWKDYGAGSFGKVGAMKMVRIDPSVEKYHHELQDYCVGFCNYKQTPGGLRLREWYAHEYGSLRHANNAAVIALYYSEYIEQSPKLEGNVWWKKGRSNTEWKADFQREAIRQVDYALGANPYGRSYLVGFGNQPFNHVHHRGSYGAWAGFLHFIPDQPEYREESRHILYGALVAGPDHNDVFLCGDKRRPWLLLPNGKDHAFFYRFPNRDEPICKEGYQWNSADQPVQDVMDSKFNEVALDYNAGFTASLAWLIAHGRSNGGPIPDDQFPPKVERNDNTDLLTTDREFFVAARILEKMNSSVTIDFTLFNRSRWPARASDKLSFRYYFTPESGVNPKDIEVSALNNKQVKVGSLQTLEDGTCFAEMTFHDAIVYPGNRGSGGDLQQLQLSFKAPQWDNQNDWSGKSLNTELQLIPNIPVYDDGQLVGGNAPDIEGKCATEYLSRYDGFIDTNQ